VLAVVAHHVGSSRAFFVRSTIWFTGGGLVTGAMVVGAAWLNGSSPGAVLFAMYQFRWRAMSVVESHGFTDRVTRLAALGSTELLSVGPLLIAALVVALVVLRLRHREPGGDWLPVAAATLTLTAYAVASVVAGGSYWGHYLVELAVPTALAAGLLVTAVPRLGSRLAAVLLIAAAVAWAGGLTYRTDAAALEIGTDVGQVAQPGDTMISALGDADTVEAAGLSSPYPYLWSLPARTLDPGQHGLRALLAGPRAPTWVVVRGPQTLTLLDPPRDHALQSHYRQVAHICGRSIYLHTGVDRPVPRQLGACTRSLSGWAGPMDDQSKELG
jgi:hypothetical protein